jgi:hypothetical protein
MLSSLTAGDIFDDIAIRKPKSPRPDKIEPKPITKSAEKVTTDVVAGETIDSAPQKRKMMQSVANIDIMEDISHVSFRRREMAPVKAEPIRIMFAGACESGKSTLCMFIFLLLTFVVRHFKVLEGKRAFAESDRVNALPEIRQFIVDNLRSFIEDMSRLKAKYTNPENQKTAEFVKERTDSKNYEWNDEWTSSVTNLWTDPTSKKMYDTKRGEFNIDDAAPYFFENAHKFTTRVYAVPQEDLLRFRVKGFSVVNAALEIDGVETVLQEKA